jgi:hypothetical protein
MEYPCFFLICDFLVLFFCYQDVLNVAPKKANWDLKRDLAKRLDILNKQTQEAIVVMIRMCCFCDGSISTCVGICVCEEV